MVKQMEDEIPLTASSPSITQETRACFDALLNAALKENKCPPKVFKRTNIQTLKKKLEAAKSSGHSSVDSQSDVPSNTKTIESSCLHSFDKTHFKTREVPVQIHTSRTNLLSSSEEDIINIRKKKKSKKSIKIKTTEEKILDNIKSYEKLSLFGDQVIEERSSSRLSNRSYTIEKSSIPLENIPSISSPVRETNSSRHSDQSYVIKKHPSSENSSIEDKETREISRPSSRISRRSYVIDKEQLSESVVITDRNVQDNEAGKRTNLRSHIIDVELISDDNIPNIGDVKPDINAMPKTPVPLPRRRTVEKLSEDASSATNTVKYITASRNDSPSMDTDNDETEYLTRLKKKKKEGVV